MTKLIVASAALEQSREVANARKNKLTEEIQKFIKDAIKAGLTETTLWSSPFSNIASSITKNSLLDLNEYNLLAELEAAGYAVSVNKTTRDDGRNNSFNVFGLKISWGTL